MSIIIDWIPNQNKFFLILIYLKQAAALTEASSAVLDASPGISRTKGALFESPISTYNCKLFEFYFV